jgi:secreted PhoX family phosphatase
MMCADPSTGETKRFLTAPPHAEVTGVVTTPDGPTTASEMVMAHKPRSSVVMITKDDGGVIGAPDSRRRHKYRA